MNKNLIFTCISIVVCFGASAQIEKGKVLAGGSVGLSTSKDKVIFDGNTTDESNTTNLWVMPRAGYFITDALAVGTGISLSTSSTKYDDDDVYTSSSISLTPFVRYYLPEGFYGQIELGLGSETDKWKPSDDDDETDKYQLFVWSIGAGYAYFLNDNVSVEPLISYTINSYTDNDNADYKYKYGTLLFQIGFNIYLDLP
jgi:hypothetical protein